MRLSKHAKRNIKTLLVVILIAILGFIMLKDSITTIMEIPPMSPYSDFQESWDNGEVDIVYYPSNGNEFRYVLFDEETRSLSFEERAKIVSFDPSRYKRTYYPVESDTFLEELVESGVRIRKSDFKPTSSILFGLLIMGAVYGLLIAIVVFIFKFQFVDAINIEPDYKTKTKFSDVIGLDEVISDLRFYVNLLNGKIKDKTVTVPKGILFSGPPGTGKTLLAKAIAGEVGCPFFSVNSSEIIDMFVGKGAKNIRSVFEKARKNAPCILFLDEIDAIGGSRNRNQQQSSEDRQTLNALLQEMDGFSSKSGVFVIAATNDAEFLDPALKRSGRFDREIRIMAPTDIPTLKKLYEHYLKSKKLCNDGVDYYQLAKQSSGLTPADIANICNEAGLINIASRGHGITTDMVVEALDKFIVKGSPSKKEPVKYENKIVRYHESGHAVVNYLQGTSIQKITVVPTTSGAGGYVKTDSPINALHVTKEVMEKQIRALYGGRISEEIKFGVEKVTIGSTSDLTEASKLIKDYIRHYSYSDSYNYIDISVFTEESNTQLISTAKGIASRLAKETKEMLEENYYLVEALANKLVENPVMSGEEVRVLLDKSKAKRENKGAKGSSSVDVINKNM